jgi:hypothetical protein
MTTQIRYTGDVKKFWIPALAAVFALLSGCHAPVMHATLQNASGGVLHTIQVDYPSASFGSNILADGAVFQYSFEVHGSSALHISYTDAAGHDHAADGPVLHEGDRGALRVVLMPDGKVQWNRE